MKKIIVLLSISIIFASCATTMQKVSLQHREYDGVKEGVIKKDLGEPLIVKGIEKYAKGIKLEQNINETVLRQLGTNYDVNLRNGEVLYFGGTKNTKEFYFSETVTPILAHEYKQGVSIDTVTDEKHLFIAQNSGSYFFDKAFDFQYSKTEYSENLCNQCFKKELVYNGRSGDEIKIIYREFVNNMARPAFTQNLSYDLSEGDIISFRGCKIKVINAKNTGIEFVILSTFNN